MCFVCWVYREGGCVVVLSEMRDCDMGLGVCVLFVDDGGGGSDVCEIDFLFEGRCDCDG